MNVEGLLDQIEGYLDDGKSSLLTGGKTRVDAEAIRSLLADIRNSFPDEMLQARKIAGERKAILNRASEAAEVTIKQAEVRARKMVEESEITKGAELRAAEIIADAKRQANDLVEKAKENSNEIVINAQNWASDLRNSASSFVETIMAETDEILTHSIEDFTKSLNKVRIASQQLKTATAKRTGSGQ